jgi:uncharacterized coiled-coil DUF342 family protein
MSKILATFRIEESDWNAFKEWAEKRGNNASSELVGFIESALGRASVQRESISLESLDNRIENCIDKCLDSKLDISIDKRIGTAIESLRDELSGIGAMGDYLTRLTAIESQISPILDSHREIEALMGK